MNRFDYLCKQARSLVLILGLTAVLPVLAACPPDTFVDQADFSHFDDDPAPDRAEDRGGHAVATNGEVVAYGMNASYNTSHHYIYLYQKGANPAQWSFLKRLTKPGDVKPFAQFSTVLAMDGDTLVAGAKHAAINSPGRVYVFRRNEGGADMWGVSQTLGGDYFDDYRDFGESLDIHRNRMVVGDTQSGAHGRVEVFERSGPNADFMHAAYLVPPAADAADSVDFAGKVTLYGDVVVVSDMGFKTAADSNSRGRVYVYARDQGGAGQWGLVTRLLSPNSTPPNGTNRFGTSISIWGSDDKTRGETIAVSSGQQHPGHVFLFGRDAGGANNWGQIVDLESPVGEGSSHFGASLHLHSNELLVGDSDAKTQIGVTAGAVYVYHQQTGGSNNWGFKQKLSTQSNNSNSVYGHALDWSAGVAVIGDPFADYGADAKVGRAYVLFDDLIFCDPFE